MGRSDAARTRNGRAAGDRVERRRRLLLRRPHERTVGDRVTHGGRPQWLAQAGRSRRRHHVLEAVRLARLDDRVQRIEFPRPPGASQLITEVDDPAEQLAGALLHLHIPSNLPLRYEYAPLQVL